MKKLKTRRLLIVPMTNEELHEKIDAECDAHMKQAYTEMLEGCLSHPKNRLWYTAWRITYRETGGEMGDLCFKGPPKTGAVEIGYGIDEAFRCRGYATEAVKAAANWAFSHSGVDFVMAETEPDNEASKRVLQKLGFLPAGEGEEGPRFMLEHPKVQWLPMFMCLGVCFGVSFGAMRDAVGLNISLGICAGLALGAALDAAEAKRRVKERRMLLQNNQ